MNATQLWIRTALFFCATIVSSSCTTSADSLQKKSGASSPPIDRAGYSVNADDFYGVYFKSGRPAENDSLLAALSETLGDSRKSLEHDLALLREFPSETTFIVVGFTDSDECTGKECIELSLRRARYVHDWLISQGVPKSRLGNPYGFGSARPIKDNASEDGRSHNRRAFISNEGS